MTAKSLKELLNTPLKEQEHPVKHLERSKIGLRVYCVGGTGIDIISPLLSEVGDLTVWDHVDFTFVDTSDSNLPNVDPSKIYRFPGLNGGGKNREYIVQKTQPHITTLLSLHKPKDVNLVIIGAGGASGAGAGPLVIRELMNRGANVLVGVVGTKSGSIKELNNTVATIKTLSNYTRITKSPLAIYYLQNDDTTSMGTVDEGMRSMVKTSAALFSNLNRGVEITDITNFLHFNRVTSYDASLVNFDFYLGTPEIPPHMQAIAQVTLEDAGVTMNDRLDIGLPGVAYRVTGVMDQSLKEALTSKKEAIHYVLTRGGMARHLKELSAHLLELEEEQQALSETIEEIDFEDGQDGDGNVY